MNLVLYFYTVESTCLKIDALYHHHVTEFTINRPLEMNRNSFVYFKPETEEEFTRQITAFLRRTDYEDMYFGTEESACGGARCPVSG